MESEFTIFPEQASSFAGRVDAVYLFLVGVSVFFTALICVLILTFAVKYRRRPHARQPQLHGGKFWMLEVGWSVVPFILVMIMFAWGAALFVHMREIPEDHDTIYVVGKQWMWKFQHSSGKREINDLHLPLGRPVKLMMISEDVIHSVYIPAFRNKMDVLPGRYTQMWFMPTKVGEYHLFCTEYCGKDHSRMRGTVYVMDPADYAEWAAANEADRIAGAEVAGAGAAADGPENAIRPAHVAGADAFEKYRCGSCHKHEGGGPGPSLVGLFGRTVPLAGGGRAVADENYIRESIFEPNAKVVAGYKSVMSTFRGQIEDEAEILQIIAYLKSLDKVPQKTQNIPPQTASLDSAAAHSPDPKPR